MSIVEEVLRERTSKVLLRVPLCAAGGRPAGAMITPVSFGVPLPRGAVRGPVCGQVTNAEGACLPAQVEPLCRWADGSTQWLLVEALFPGDFVVQDLALALSLAADPPHSDQRVIVRESRTGWMIETGPAAFEIDRHWARPFTAAHWYNVAVCQPGCAVWLTDRKGRRHAAHCDGWRLESAGPLRATLVGQGCFRREPGLRLALRLSFFAGTGLVNLEATLHNPRRARHPGGTWDLGDRGSVLFRDLSVEISPAGARKLHWSVSTEQQSESCSLQLWELYQDSSGGENWDSVNHVNREGRVPCRFRGYRLKTAHEQVHGLRADPTLMLKTPSASISLAVPEFWQQFPKAISLDPRRLRVGLFPAEFDDLHELQGGERKTHAMWLQVAEPDANPGGLAWVHDPVVVQPTAEWCDQTRSLPSMVLHDEPALGNLELLLSEALDGSKSLFVNREKADEYGWRNHGEIFADHEQAYYKGTLPLISHYNNQFDMVRGFLLHYLRTGDQRWRQLGDALARHVVDIDLYHTRRDKALYSGGPFWVTDHYLHARTSTHRTYSRFNRPKNRDYGGGPGAGHNYTTGLLLHYFLTGNVYSRDAVLQLADWVMAIDDGRRTVLGIADDGFTGRASGDCDFQGPGRPSGNSLNALLDAWLLSRRKSYLDYAELLIRRCIHPADDIAAHDLLNVEQRWSYTIFLTSLSKYLDVKIEAGQLDQMAAYARASLLHYATWMLENEKPYFDQVEKLEFPTEAWAAQELRKANVMRLAAQYAAEPVRTSLIKRGTELADRAWIDLLRFETRACARALAIVMIEGLKDCSFRSCGVPAAAQVEPSRHFDKRETLVPQRRRVQEQLRRPRGMIGIALKIINPVRLMRFYRLRYSE